MFVCACLVDAWIRTLVLILSTVAVAEDVYAEWNNTAAAAAIGIVSLLIVHQLERRRSREVNSVHCEG